MLDELDLLRRFAMSFETWRHNHSPLRADEATADLMSRFIHWRQRYGVKLYNLKERDET